MKMPSYQFCNSHFKKRQPWDCLIFIIRITISVTHNLYIESLSWSYPSLAPSYHQYVFCTFNVLRCFCSKFFKLFLNELKHKVHLSPPRLPLFYSEGDCQMADTGKIRTCATKEKMLWSEIFFFGQAQGINFLVYESFNNSTGMIGVAKAWHDLEILDIQGSVST